MVLDLSGEPLYPFMETLARHGVGGADMPRLVSYALEPKNLKNGRQKISLIFVKIGVVNSVRCMHAVV